MLDPISIARLGACSDLVSDSRMDTTGVATNRSASGEYGSALRELFDPEAIVERVVDELLVLIPHADGAVLGVAMEDGLIRFVRTAGAVGDLQGGSVSAAESLSGLAMRTATVLRCDDAGADARIDAAVMAQIGMASQVSVPLLRQGIAFGTVNVLARRSHAFSEQDVATCSALADVLGGIILCGAEVSRIVDRLDQETVADLASNGNGPTCTESVGRFVTNVFSPTTTHRIDLQRRVRDAIVHRQFSMVYQPVLSLTTASVVSVEALARFHGPPHQSPDRWFADAAVAKLDVELELAAVTMAVAALDSLPGDATLAVNVGPDAIATPDFLAIVEGVDAARVVIELTEHAAVHDYGALQAAIAHLRRLGARLSIDDTGAGFASLTHIVQLGPDFVKLDRWMVAGVGTDPMRRAVVAALVAFAHELGAEVVGEGIETAAEMRTLQDLGVDYGQGFYLARPGPLADLRTAFTRLPSLSSPDAG